MKAYLIFFSFLFILITNLNAQNTILIDDPKPIPNKLKKVIGDRLAQGDSLQNFTNKLIDRIAKDHLTHIKSDIRLYNLYGWDDYYFVNALRTDLVKDKKKLKKVYKAIKPFIQAHFKQMTTNEQSLQLERLNKALAYIEGFDLEREKADLDSLGGRYSFIEEKGELKAFIYRRIVNDGFSKKECLKWTKQLISDLKPLLNEAKPKIDQYFIKEKHGKYLLASNYPLDKKSYVLLEQKNGKYEEVNPIKGGELITNDRWGIHLPVNRKLGNGSVLQPYRMKDQKIRIYWFQDGAKPVLIEETDGKARLNLNKFGYLKSENLVINDKTVYAKNKTGEIEKIKLEIKPNREPLFMLEFKDGSKKLIVRDKDLKLDGIEVVELYHLHQGVAVMSKNKELHLLEDKGKIIRFGADLKKVVSKPGLCLWVLENEEALLWVYKNRYQSVLDYIEIKLPKEYQYRDIEEIAYKQNELVFTSKNGKKGLLNRKGELLIKADYSQIKNFLPPADRYDFSGVYLCQKSEDAGSFIMAKGNKQLFDEPIKEVYFLGKDEQNKGLICFKSNKTNKWGVLNEEMKLIVPPKYASIKFKNGRGDQKSCLWVSSQTKEFKMLSNSESLVESRLKERFGVLDLEGNEILAEQYFFIEDLSVNKTVRYLLGKQISPQKYAFALADQYYKPITDFKFNYRGTLDTIISFDPETFEELVDIVPIYDIFIIDRKTGGRMEGIYKFLVDGKLGLFDLDGKSIMKPEWDDFVIKTEKMHAYVEDGDKKGVFDLNSRKIWIPVKYKDLKILAYEPQFTALVQSVENGLYGVIYEPKAKPSFLYKEIEPFIVGNAVLFVSKDGQKFAMFKDGKTITDFIFEKQKKEVVTFDPETFEEILEEIYIAFDQYFSRRSQTLILYDDPTWGLYNLKGERLKTESIEELQKEQRIMDKNKE